MDSDYLALINIHRDSRGISNFIVSSRNFTIQSQEAQEGESCYRAQISTQKGKWKQR